MAHLMLAKDDIARYREWRKIQQNAIDVNVP